MLRILITGSREVNGAAERLIVAALDDALMGVPAERRSEIVIVHGGARGVDTVAQFWATGAGLHAEQHFADWDEYGKAAGHRRNQEMVDASASVCLAFPRRSSRGTWDCIRRAADAGIPVRIYPLPELP